MFLSRQRPVVSRTCTTTFWSIRTYKVQAERKKTGPAKGKLLDPDDPSKTINRSKVINYRPRGRTMKRASEKSTLPSFPSFPRAKSLHILAESDAMGRMIYQDVSVDVNGIPQKIPDIYYQRFPIIKTKPESYEDWKRRRAGIRQQVEGFCKDVQQLKLDVSKFAWERDLDKRKPPTESEFEFNQKVIDILAGRLFGSLVDRRAARPSSQGWSNFQSKRFAKSNCLSCVASSCHHQCGTSGKPSRDWKSHKQIYSRNHRYCMIRVIFRLTTGHSETVGGRY